MGIPALPKQRGPESIVYELNNTGLSKRQFDELRDPTKDNYIIIYTGDFKHLDFLFQQVACAKNKEIKISLMRVDVDKTVYLPFSILGPNTTIMFNDSVNRESNFNNYLINLRGPEYDAFTLHSNLEQVARLNGERRIQIEFLKSLRDALNGRNRDYSKDELMNVIFNYVRDKYPYDMTIVGKHGEYTGATSVGSTALGTYERGAGVCSGRSKLIKLYTNNFGLEIPCYLAGGKHGSLDHMWNEYIDERGNVIEYDASYGTICRLEDLPSPYVLKEHEPDVIKHLKRRGK